MMAIIGKINGERDDKSESYIDKVIGRLCDDAFSDKA